MNDDLKKAGKVGCLVIAGAFLLLIVVIIIWGPEPEKPIVDGASEIEKISGKSEESPDPDAKPAMMANWYQLNRAVQPCDAANTEAAEILEKASSGQASVYEAFAIATKAEDLCSDATIHLGKMVAPPQITTEQQEKLTKSFETCEDTYLIRTMALQTMLEVLDGDSRPSKVQEYVEKTEAASGGIMACLAGFMGVAIDVGVTAKELETTADPTIGKSSNRD